LKVKYHLMAREMNLKEKSKTYLVDNLLYGIGFPSIEQVANIHLLKNFKVPNIATFTGLEDPTRHLENY
jgi:hypothetical protein